MKKTPEEREAAAQRRVEAMIQNLNEGATRDALITDKIIEEVDRKHALKMKADGSSRDTVGGGAMEMTREERRKARSQATHKAIMSAFGPQHAKDSHESSGAPSLEESGLAAGPLLTKSSQVSPQETKDSGAS